MSRKGAGAGKEQAQEQEQEQDQVQQQKGKTKSMEYGGGGADVWLVTRGTDLTVLYQTVFLLFCNKMQQRCWFKPSGIPIFKNWQSLE
jgi:hypothetical protein